MKIYLSREYGGWVTTILTFIFSISIYLIFDKNLLYLIIFWIPVLIGLTFYDLRINEVSLFYLFFILIGIAFAILSLIFLYYFIVPYSLFLLSYLLRIKKINNIFVTLTGLMGQVLMLYYSLVYIGFHSYLFIIMLFLYLYGSEFGVRSFIKKNFYYSIYNLIPFFISLITYPIFFLAILRLFYFKIKNIKFVGVSESTLYAVIITFFLIRALLFHQV